MSEATRTLDGKVAVVTGASRGIGAAIARRLGAMGATVLGTATTPEGAERLAAALREAGVAAHGHVLDVADPGSVAAFVERVQADHGTVAVLVNNAGITRDNLLMRMKDEEWEAVLRTNLDSVFRLSRAFLRGMMKARWGRIVNITSVVAGLGNPGQTNYCAAKAGMIGFTRALAREVGSRGITVNAVAPGFIETDMTKALPQAQRARLLAQIPLGRLGSPEDVAAAVGFLCSPEAGYVTGATLHVNGGMYMG